MANPDFLLTVGVDAGLSYKPMRKGISELVSKINKDPVGIKVGLDPASIKKMQDDIKVALSDSKFNADMKIKFDSEEFNKFSTTATDALTNISNLVTEISKKSLGLNLNISEAQSAQEQIAGVRAEVLAYARSIEQAQSLIVDLNNRGMKGALAQQGADLGKAVGEMVTYRTELSRIIESIDKQNTLTGLRVRQEELENLRAAIVPVIEAANKLGAINFDVNKLIPVDIPKNVESGIEKAKQLFEGLGNTGGNSADGIKQQAEAITEMLRAFQDEVTKISDASKNYDIHKVAVDAAAQAENAKAEASRGLSERLEEESNATNKSSRSMSEHTRAYGDAKRAIEEYYSALNKLDKNQEARTDITQASDGSGWVSKSGKYQELTDELNRTKTAFDLVTDAEHRSMMTANEQIRVNELLAKKQREFALASEENANRREAAEKRIAAAAAKRAADTAAREEAQRLRQQTEEAVRSQEKIDAALQKAVDHITEYEAAFNKIGMRLGDVKKPTEDLIASYDRLRSLLDVLKSADVSSSDKINADKSWAVAKRELNTLLDYELDIQRRVESAEKSAASASAAEAKEIANENTALSKAQEDLAAKADAASQKLLGLYDSIGKLKDAGKVDASGLNELVNLLRVINDPTQDASARVQAYKSFSATISEVTREVRLLSEAEKEEAAAAAKSAAEEKAKQKDARERADIIARINGLIQECAASEKKYALSGFAKKSGKLNEIKETKEQLANLKKEIESGEATTAKASATFSDFRNKLVGIRAELKTGGNFFSNWWSNGITQLSSRMAMTFGLVNVVNKSIQGIKKMVSTAVELDTAMNQLQVVTRSSKQDMDAYADSVSKIAKETAQSTKDMIEATTVYARLGYTMDESSVLAKYTAMLQGVGDIDSSAAQDAMTAIVKAFHKNVDDIESIMDKMVVVGNNFPISVSQIAEGMNNAGSALAASGNSLDQSIALLTAANTTVQNVSKSSTGLRTIAARIRKTTVELDDLGETVEEAKYQKVIDMLTGKGVDFTVNGEYRSTYDILKSIAGVWNQLSSMEKAGVAEQLAGTRQQNVFFSIIEQFQEAESAMERMKNSSGELQNAFDIYMGSIQAHVNQLKAAFEDLSMASVDSDFAKGAVDFLTKVLEILTDLIEQFGVLKTLIGGGVIISILKMLASKDLGSIGKTGAIGALATVGKNLALIWEKAKMIPAILKGASEGALMTAGSFEALVASMAPVITTIGAIGAIAAVAFGGGAIIGHLDEVAHGFDYANKKAQEEKDAYDDLAAQYDANTKRVEELNKAKMHGTITAEQNSELLILQAQNKALETQIALQEEKYKIASDHKRDVALEKADEILNPKVDEFSTSVEQEIAAYKVAKDFLETTSNKDRGISAFKQATDVLQKRMEYTKSVIESLDAEKDAAIIAELTDQIQTISDIISGITPETREALNELEKLQRGGNVDLTVRPVIDTDVLRAAGWTGENDPGDGGATVHSVTVSNPAKTVAMNFTPIMVDENGDFKGVLSPEELQKYGEEVIAGVREDDLNLKIGATFYGEDAIDKAVEAAVAIHELHDTIYEEEINAIMQKKERYQKFQRDFEGLTDDTKKAIIRVFKDGAKAEDELTDDRIRSLGKWLNECEYTYEEAEEFFEKMFRKQTDMSKSAATSNVSDLATIRDELAATSKAWEEYNSTTSYEHGDQAAQMKAALEKAQADIKAGRIGANSIWGAGKLIFSDEQLAAMGYDPAQIANALNNSVLNQLFTGEESEIGIRFANMLRDNADALSEFIRVANNGDGTFDIIFDDYKGLASALNLSDDAFAMLLDAMQGFTAQSIRQTGDIQEITNKYLTLKNALGDAKEAAIELTRYMASQESSEFEAIDVLKNLRNYGVISFSDTELGQIVGQGFASVESLNNAEAEPKLLADDTDLQGKIDYAFSRLRELNGTRSRAYIDAYYREVGPSTSSAYGYSSKGSGSGGSSIERTMTAGAEGINGGKAQEALVNELGAELISDNGKAYIANGGKPGFTRLSKDAIVFTAEETKKIFGTRYSNIPVRAFAAGSPNSSIRDMLISGSKARAYIGGTEAWFTCGNCGARWTYSLLSNPRGFTGTCMYCGSRYQNGSLVTSHEVKTKSPEVTIASPTTYPVVTPSYGYDSYDYGGGYGGGYSSGYDTPAEPTKVDWIAVAIDRIQRAVQALEKVASSTFKKLSTRVNATKEEMGELTKEIETQQAGYTRYLSEAENVGLSSDLAAKVREGAIEITEYDEATRKLIDEYSEWYEKALDCKYAVEDLHQELAQLYMDNFQNTQADYENRLSETEHIIEMINKDISMAQTRGYIDSADFYSSLAGNTADQIATLKYELNDLNRYFNEAMESGEIEEGSEAWYEMKQAINEVEESLADANIQLEEYKNKVREINWGYFDYAQERISKISEEANFLINLMSNDRLFQDNGQFNDLGQATAGMHVINYDTYMAQADEYAKEMEKIQRDLANDPYNKTLIERRDELLDLQRQSILNAEAEKNAVKDLVAEGIQLELSALQELIDAYENSLDSAKELYDYQQKVAKQTGDIAALEKQLSAYQNDTSEENRARVQKLQQQLKDARQGLSDTEYDKSISDQKQLLSDLYNEYEEALNGRLDNVDALMAEIINGANANREAIIQTITSVSDLVGYTVTDGLNNVMHEQFANYSSMFEDVTGIHTALVNIYDLVASMASASGAVKAYAKGGLIDYTGIAAVHGTPGNPEMVLSAADTKMFLEAAAMMRGVNDMIPAIGSDVLTVGRGSGGGIQIGTLEVNIPIGRVLDYNDMIAQMQKDPKFDRLINAITLDRATGKSNLSKYGVKFS